MAWCIGGDSLAYMIEDGVARNTENFTGNHAVISTYITT